MKIDELITVRIPAQTIYRYTHGGDPESSDNWVEQQLWEPLLNEELTLMENVPAFLLKYQNQIRISLEWEALPDLNTVRPWETGSLRNFVHDLDSHFGSVFFYHPWSPAEYRLFAACLTDPTLVTKEEGKTVITGMDVYFGESLISQDIQKFNDKMSEHERMLCNEWGFTMPGHHEAKSVLNRWNAFFMYERHLKGLFNALLDYHGFLLRMGESQENIYIKINRLLDILGINSKTTWENIINLYKEAGNEMSTRHLNASAALPFQARQYYRQKNGIPAPHWTHL